LTRVWWCVALLWQDPECESLLHFQEQAKWSAKRGPSGAGAPPPSGDRKRTRAAPPVRAAPRRAQTQCRPAR
jgi:hypothetical protein